MSDTDVCSICLGIHSQPWNSATAAEEYALRMTNDNREHLMLTLAYLIGVGECAAHVRASVQR